MPETALTPVSAPGKWSTAGVALTMAAVDNSSGNKFTAPTDGIVIVQNTDSGSHTYQMTSQALPAGRGEGRTGSVSQSMAAGEIRVFRVTQAGWMDSNGNILIPASLDTHLKVAIVIL